ncbi:hypothetical protein RO3G_06860 [Rhizopus delemar RA 99-880]|uniref:Ricin B lectin domain-containing protein n=1 Tax=Rhizopus delemar (strain RA 99-880 / ATCC MYA-4621 / FGSC 9543 / NRRL 43880) TaxID=246409 RepID=I1C125_RHIO9|nr:hypothetical protein RO3G_06860 [Rhizopus delemar RA 99-880]|eukprot:EIE82155.1 hypothetical protein RO3G_06860 [Rhizopus delemar RA 99-880]
MKAILSLAFSFFFFFLILFLWKTFLLAIFILNLETQEKWLMFLQVDGASTKNDGKIILWTAKYNEDRDNQLWYYQQEGWIYSQ